MERHLLTRDPGLCRQVLLSRVANLTPACPLGTMPLALASFFETTIQVIESLLNFSQDLVLLEKEFHLL